MTNTIGDNEDLQIIAKEVLQKYSLLLQQVPSIGPQNFRQFFILQILLLPNFALISRLFECDVENFFCNNFVL